MEKGDSVTEKRVVEGVDQSSDYAGEEGEKPKVEAESRESWKEHQECREESVPPRGETDHRTLQ